MNITRIIGRKLNLIIKIWPIKADYANVPNKVGGVEGLKNALEYISNENKVIVKQDNLHDIPVMKEEKYDENDDFIKNNTVRVIEYMSNTDKVKGKYISGYLCDPENAVSEFDIARILTLAKTNTEREKETGAVAYHIVQSFPKDLDISDEEVHQCGIELCKKLNAHQAVICSHVHPEIDENNGEIHGACKHNHILINAYIHPEKLDSEHPNRLKYNDCKESYAQLREWNDEIAIEHGLPIIRNPDDERTYSWIESEAVNKGLSWKERIRMDIELARRISTNWSEFVSVMEKNGYKIRDTAHITYTAPDGKHKARGETLGMQYTKENLMLYWSMREYTKKAVEESLKDNSRSPLSNLMKNADDVLYAGIPIGKQGQENRKIHYLPLGKENKDRSVLETYFNLDELYDIFDKDYKAIADATGAEIISYIEDLQYSERDKTKSTSEREQEYNEAQNKKKYYTYVLYINSRTKKPYRTSLYDQNGRRRSSLELLFLLAIIVLKKEDGLWKPSKIPPKYKNDVIYAPTNWKIQNMIDAMYTAQSEGIENMGQLERRLQDAGAAYSRAKSALGKTVRAKEKMDTLNQAVSEYRLTDELVKRINAMPDGKEKTALQEKYKDIITRYKNAKTVMYHYQVTEENQIVDFENRYIKIQEDIKTLEEKLDETKEEYRKLKKLSYNASLAENAQYCYGPNYTYEHTHKQKNNEKQSDNQEKENINLDENKQQIDKN